MSVSSAERGAPRQKHAEMTENALSLKARYSLIWDEVAATSGFWSWGDAEGVIPWQGPRRSVLAPLWPSRAWAEASNANDSDSGEHPMHLPLTELKAKVDGWCEGGGVDGVALFPYRNRITMTLELDEFRPRLVKELRTRGWSDSDLGDLPEWSARQRLP